MKIQIQKKGSKKYVLVDQNNMIISSEYIPTLKKAKQEKKDLKEYLKNPFKI